MLRLRICTHHLYLRRILPASSLEMPRTDVTASMTSCCRLLMSVLVRTTYLVCRSSSRRMCVRVGRTLEHPCKQQQNCSANLPTPHLALMGVCCCVKIVIIISIHGGIRDLPGVAVLIKV